MLDLKLPLQARTQESLRQRLEKVRGQLEENRSSFISHWKELSDWILPRRQQFTLSDANRGDRRNKNIIDSTATLASRTLRSGMMGGVTSPARPWFRLTTPDPGLAEFGPVREYLHQVQSRMTTTFLKSNLYNVLPTLYGDLGTFGTAPIAIEEDLSGEVIRTISFPIGSYAIAQDHKGRINCFYRSYRMTIRQVVEEFGKLTDAGRIDWSIFSDHVKEQYEQGNYETWIEVAHFILPNVEYDAKKRLPKYKKFASYHYERGIGAGSSGSAPGYGVRRDSQDLMLRVSGFDYFPILCPRWEVTGGDIYGTDCPGMTALGDVKALQLMHKRKSQAIEKMVFPPLKGPAALMNQAVNQLPGGVTYTDEREGMRGLTPIHEVNPRIQELLMDIRDHQDRVKRAYFEDLFLMLASSDRRQITAREIDERHEEKLLALGPVLEQLNQDLLDPLIDITYDIQNRQRGFPKPPKELQGVPLKIEYLSVMAQAQKSIGIGGVERFMGFAGQVAQFNPKVLDKIDTDQIIDIYGEYTGIPPNLIKSDDVVMEERSQREQAAAQAQAQQMQMQQEVAGAEAAEKLSRADLEGDNALTRMLTGEEAAV